MWCRLSGRRSGVQERGEGIGRAVRPQLCGSRRSKGVGWTVRPWVLSSRRGEGVRRAVGVQVWGSRRGKGVGGRGDTGLGFEEM